MPRGRSLLLQCVGSVLGGNRYPIFHHFPASPRFSPSGGGDKKLEAFFRNSFAPAGEVEKFRSIATIKSGTRVIQTIAHCCFRGRSPGGRLGHLIYATNYFKSFVAAAILQIALLV